MQETSTTNIRFNCPECKSAVSNEVHVPPVDFSWEPLSESVSEGDVDLHCRRCDSTFSARVQNTPAGCFVELDEHPDVEVQADDAYFTSGPLDDEDWLDLQPPTEEPFNLLDETCIRLRAFASGFAGDNKPSHAVPPRDIYYMVYAAGITALEAFLADNLSKYVFSDRAAFLRLLEHDESLKKESVTLLKIATTPDIVVARTRNYLGGLMYHNLPKIAVLYRIAFGFEIFTEDAFRDELNRAVQTRHHIVHRNGKDKEGVPTNLSLQDVLALLNNVHRLALHIHRQMQGYLSGPLQDA